MKQQLQVHDALTLCWFHTECFKCDNAIISFLNSIISQVFTALDYDYQVHVQRWPFKAR